MTVILTVSFLYLISYSVVKTTNAETAEGFLWDVVIKTCDSDNAGTDARVYLKVYFEQGHTQQTFELDSQSHNDFEQGQRDHYRLALSQNDVINVGLYWWPSWTFSEGWCVDWVALMNSRDSRCLVAQFERWIMHYRDPPTYPQLFERRKYSDCILPPKLKPKVMEPW